MRSGKFWPEPLVAQRIWGMSQGDPGHYCRRMEETNGWVSYDEFGRQFFAVAVTEERVLAGVNTLAGQPIDFGPIGVGPAKIAQVSAHGAIGEARATREPGDEVVFRVVLPVQLDFVVDLAVDTHRFAATLAIPLLLTAKAVDGLAIFIDVRPPRSEEIGLELNAKGLRASILQRVAGIEGEVKRFVARFVAREIEKEKVRKARTIDVARAVGGAWQSVAPRDEAADPVGVAGDFAEAAASELSAADAPAN